ncbi:MAG: glycosyltransferase family 2 protein [Rhodospirillaceae bacterium]|nr:glycosyltransferase family 2 protein [Rhodospirillaceae bacterium]
MITVSIAICTRDRPERLHTLLDSFVRLAPPVDTGWELLVVDNGSGPGTSEVARSFAAMLPIRRVHEPRAGLSIARNRALEIAGGAWIAFTDDDVTVPPTWLANLVGAFRAFPEAAFFGGPIRAEIAGIADERLAVYREVVPGALVHLDPGYGWCSLVRTGWGFPWGANIAFRCDALDGLRFDPRLGRKPGDGFQIGEETQLIDTLLERGQFGLWLPDNRVTHHTDRSRLRRRYLHHYYYQVGWLMGERTARTDRTEQVSVTEAAQQRLDSNRSLRLQFLNSLPERLTRLRDRSIDRGLLDGLIAARQSPARDTTVPGRVRFHV